MFGITAPQPERLSNDNLLFPSRGSSATSDLPLALLPYVHATSGPILAQKYFLTATLHTMP